MNKNVDIVAYENTYNPCLLVLKSKGYSVSAEDVDGSLHWFAKKDDSTLMAYSPPELLGLAALIEAFGVNWNQQTPNYLGEILDSSE
jgi:hypothetical protein